MFGFKKSKKNAEAVETVKVPDFVEAKSFYGMSIHVFDNKENKVVCGYDNPMITNIEITPEMMLSTIDKQHAGFMWCADCGEGFTDKSAEDFLNGRNSR